MTLMIADAALTTIAAIAAATAAVGGGVASGVMASKANSQQQDALAAQKKAQAESLANAGAAQRESEQAIGAANRREPDMQSIMGKAAEASGGGPSSTMLTGPTGVNAGQMALGRSTLLGS